MNYSVLLALHIIFVVSWFAALFYIVRLFIYHTEADKKPEPERSILQKQYKLMERRLWYIIGWPAMILATLFGILMLVEHSFLLEMSYMHLKLGLVFGLILYHLACQRLLIQFKNDQINYSSFKLRLWNEIATIFLFAVVFTIEMREEMNWIAGLAGFFILTIGLMVATKLYKKKRDKKGE